MAQSSKSSDEREMGSKLKKTSDNSPWSACEEESDEYHSAEDGEYGDDKQSSNCKYLDADDREPDCCIICGGYDDNALGFGELLRGVCGCKRSVYHFPCLVDRIKKSRDAPCICGQRFTHRRIRRVRYTSFKRPFHGSVSLVGVTLIMFLAFFGSFLASLIYREPNEEIFK